MNDQLSRAERRQRERRLEQMRIDIERAERHAERFGGDALIDVGLDNADEYAGELLDDDPWTTNGYDPLECLAWLIDSGLAVPVVHAGGVVGWTVNPRPDKSKWASPRPAPILAPWSADGATVDIDLLRAEVTGAIAAMDEDRLCLASDAIEENLAARPEMAGHADELAAMVTALVEAYDRLGD